MKYARSSCHRALLPLRLREVIPVVHEDEAATVVSCPCGGASWNQAGIRGLFSFIVASTRWLACDSPMASSLDLQNREEVGIRFV